MWFGCSGGDCLCSWICGDVISFIRGAGFRGVWWVRFMALWFSVCCRWVVIWL